MCNNTDLEISVTVESRRMEETTVVASTSVNEVSPQTREEYARYLSKHCYLHTRIECSVIDLVEIFLIGAEVMHSSKTLKMPFRRSHQKHPC